jgi:glycosyltransferase involved in cell wall biosynthesis
MLPRWKCNSAVGINGAAAEPPPGMRRSLLVAELVASAGSPKSFLLVCDTYPPVIGGSEIEAQRVCAALIKRGHRVTVLCAGGPPMPDLSEWVDPMGVPVRIFGRSSAARRRGFGFALGVAWTLLTRRNRYQFIYFLMQGLHLAVGLPVARVLRKPILMKVSGSGVFPLLQRSWIGRFELRCLAKWASRVMVLNPGMAREAAAAGINPEQLLWMPNPVDTEEFAPCDQDQKLRLRSQLKIPADALNILYVGRLAPEKELPSLLDAFARVAATVPNARLTFVGDGPVRQSLMDAAREMQLEPRVRFAGQQTGTEVQAWLQASDVFALTSSLEGFPCSLVEAMSAGLPSVVSDIPANAQLVDSEVHGFRVAVRDEAAIANALQCLLQNEALRREMGAAARSRVTKQYSTDKVLSRYEDLFEETLAGS